MEAYHKIHAPFKRHMDGPNKGKLIVGDWARPEFGYLANNQWEFTEKVDGTNIRVMIDRDPDNDYTEVNFAGRSDNALIPKPLKNVLTALFGVGDATITNKIMIWMMENDLTSVVLYGEGYGPKIQGGGKYSESHDFVLFDVNIGGHWLDRDNVFDVADKLDLEPVPVLGTGTLRDAIHIVKGETWVKAGVIQPTDGFLKSAWGDFEAEGIVARPVVPLFDRMGNRIITKIKAKDFK